MREYTEQSILPAELVKKGFLLETNQMFAALKRLRATSEIVGDVELVVRAKPHKDDRNKCIIEYTICDLDSVGFIGGDNSN